MVTKLASATQRPLLSPEQMAAEAAFVAVMRLANEFVADGEAFFKKHGLTLAQYNTLRVLRDADNDGMPCQQIGEALIARDPDITRLTDRLEDRGLVAKERSAQDRRVVKVRLTPEGVELVNSLDWLVVEQNDAQIAALNLAEKRQFLALLEKIMRSRQGLIAPGDD
jgi:DNA-binding MarR family transcriptional regulator